MWKKVSFTDFKRTFVSANDIKKVRELDSYRSILRGLSRRVINRSVGCRVTPFRKYRNNLWTFRVNCTGTTYSVWVKAIPENDAPESKFNLHVKCTCPFWKWNGPDFNAYNQKYLYGRPFSNRSAPDIRDPKREYKVCKHVYAVLQQAASLTVVETEAQERIRLEREKEELLKTQKEEDRRKKREDDKMRKEEDRKKKEDDKRKKERSQPPALGRDPFKERGMVPKGDGAPETKKEDRKRDNTKRTSPALGRDPFKERGMVPED